MKHVQEVTPPLTSQSVFDRTALIHKSYELFRLVQKPIGNFQKPWRYTIGERLQSTLLKVVEETGQGLYARQPLKEQYILRLLGTIQTLTLFIRLSYDEKLITEQQFFSWSDRVEELGRMAAGWLTSVRQK